MRVWIVLGVGALMVAAIVLPGGVWGATIDDVAAEVAKETRTLQYNGRLVMLVPMEDNGIVHMPITELCVAGGKLRPIRKDVAPIDMGPAAPGNQYTVRVMLRNAIGDEQFLYSRQVSIPDCK